MSLPRRIICVARAPIATQIFSGFGSIALTQQTRESGGVAYFAHIGGAIAGLVLVWLFRTPRMQQRAQEHYNFGSTGRY